MLTVMSNARLAEIAEIDAYLAEQKTLAEREPIWVRPHEQTKNHTCTASWPVRDSAGITRGELRFRFNTEKRDNPSVSLLYARRPIYRIDIVPESEAHWNGLIAQRFGLPPTILGTHRHRWDYNRDYLAIQSPQDWHLGIKEPLPSVRRLPQALAELAAATNIVLTPMQRGFDIPPQRHLFEGGQ